MLAASVRRTVAREEIWLGEHLHGTDRGNDDGEENCRAKRRNRDEPELLPTIRTVDRGRFVLISRYRLHAGQVDQCVVPRPTPGDDRSNGGLRLPLGAVCPIDVMNTEEMEDPVDETVIATEQLSEDQRARDHGCGVWHQHCDSEERPSPVSY